MITCKNWTGTLRLICNNLNSVSLHSTNGKPLRIRLGEWDASSNIEPIASQEYTVARIFIHPSFTAGNLRNDIAIIRLSSSVQLGVTPTITTACLPLNPLSGTRCWVRSWQNLLYNIYFKIKLRSVDGEKMIFPQTACIKLFKRKWMYH